MTIGARFLGNVSHSVGNVVVFMGAYRWGTSTYASRPTPMVSMVSHYGAARCCWGGCPLLGCKRPRRLGSGRGVQNTRGQWRRGRPGLGLPIYRECWSGLGLHPDLRHIRHPSERAIGGSTVCGQVVLPDVQFDWVQVVEQPLGVWLANSPGYPSWGVTNDGSTGVGWDAWYWVQPGDTEVQVQFRNRYWPWWDWGPVRVCTFVEDNGDGVTQGVALAFQLRRSIPTPHISNRTGSR